MLLSCFSIILIVFLYGCCKDELNNSPTIKSLVSNPDTISTNSVSTLTCSAEDPDGDDLTFFWETEAGTIDGSGSTVRWSSPNTAGEYFISCRVSDGNSGEDIGSVKIVVEQPIPTQGLIAYYPFNGNANDESGNEINGTVIGPTLSTDRHGNANSAYSFDGVDDYIEADASLLPTAERTISVWFYTNSVDNRPSVLGYGGGGGATSWFMVINANGQRSFHMSCHWLVNRIDYYYSKPPIENWYHWVITINNNGTKVYVNGVEEVSNTTFIDNTIVNGTELGIGVISSTAGVVPYTDGNVKYFNGMIDDIRIYNRALSIEEIQILYQEGGWGD